MPVYGKGACLFDEKKTCVLGDKGIEVDPVYCHACALRLLVEAIEKLRKVKQ